MKKESDIYSEAKKHFSGEERVVVNDGKGAQGIKYKGKMFAMFYKGDLALRFAPDRVTELVKKGKALPMDPGTGKPMKDRVIIPAAKSDNWIQLAKESLDYVSS